MCVRPSYHEMCGIWECGDETRTEQNMKKPWSWLIVQCSKESRSRREIVSKTRGQNNRSGQDGGMECALCRMLQQELDWIGLVIDEYMLDGISKKAVVSASPASNANARPHMQMPKAPMTEFGLLEAILRGPTNTYWS